MNRKQRRAKEKELGVAKKLNATPVVPVAIPSIETLIKKYPDIAYAVEKFEAKCKLEASNDTFNVCLGAMLVALHDKHDFIADQLNTLIEQTITQLECVSLKLVTPADLMGLLKEQGVLIQGLDPKTIQNNAEEVLRKLKVYEEGKEEMTKKEKAFECFDAGIIDSQTVANKIESTVGSVYKYKQLWKQAKLANMSTEEFTDKLFETDISASKENKLQEENVAREDEVVMKEKEPVKNENTTIETQAPVQEKKPTLEVPKKAPKFEVKRTVEIEAEFGTYTIQNQVADVKLDTKEMGLTKADLLAFAEELTAVAGEMQ